MSFTGNIAALRRRLEEWLAASISNRITFAALSLTMVVALVIGISSYGVVTLLVRRSVAAELNSQARLALQRLQTDLNALSADLRNMAGNSFVANGLVDSLGRDTYLLPFLHEHRGSLPFKPMVVLCDYRGRPVAANQPGVPELPALPAIQQALKGAQPGAQILKQERGTFLVLVQPVIFPPTGQPEGVLVAMVDLLQLFRSATHHLGPEYQAQLRAGEEPVLRGSGQEVRSGHFGLRQPLVLAAPLDTLKLSFELALAHGVAATPMEWAALLYLIFCLALLLPAARFAQATARRLTLPLASLSSTASSIAAGGSLEVSAQVAGQDEVATMAAAFNDMLGKLRASQEQLESQVASRTRELKEAHDLLELRVEQRTAQLTEAKQRLERETESKLQLEQQLRQAQKMEAIGTLAGGIAHDFNNILTVIGSYSMLTAMELPEQDPLKRNLDQIMTATERAAKLTSSLLAFSRKQMTDPRDCDLNGIISHVEKFLTRVIGEDIELTTSFKIAPLPVHVDSGQMEQVLMNLAANARDAMPGGGLLSIETCTRVVDQNYIEAHGPEQAPGAYAVVRVSDSGIGMDRETMRKIFEPFYTTKEVGKGTGLGLAMVYGIIKQNNGHIQVSSEPGRGTSFEISLPLLSGEGQLEAGRAASGAAITGGTETILVAEDDPDIRTVVELVLSQAGYRVILAVDGEDAVEKFQQNRREIGLVLLDMIMPKKSGKAAYDAIRQLEPGVRALFSSGYLADHIKSRGELDEGAEMVCKPVHPSELLRKVREILDGKG